jgi:hypothetical protein
VKALRHGHQEAVAEIVPEAVVDELETIEVDEAEGEQRVPALQARQRELQAIAEQKTVGKAGQRIVLGQALEVLAIGHVACDRVPGVALVVRSPGKGAPAPVLAAIAVLEARHLAARQASDGDRPLDVVGVDEGETRTAGQLLDRPAEEPLPGRIQSREVPVGDGCEEVAREVDQSPGWGSELEGTTGEAAAVVTVLTGIVLSVARPPEPVPLSALQDWP